MSRDEDGAIRVRFTQARWYQRELIDWFRDGGRYAFEYWHRKAGKDRVATFIESELCWKRVGLYWHALPKYEDARKVIWDAITPEGTRLIDACFPDEICKKKNSHEMKIELRNGSIWQPVGADNFNSLVGASPVHVTYSEFALMHANARRYIRPALAQNNGTELIITTARGFNHASDLYEYAKANPKLWHSSLLTVDDTKAIPEHILEEERRTMPEELFRQEYYCDRNAANVGAVIGKYIEAAEREGRVSEQWDFDRDGMPLQVSVDIGRGDATAAWFWQPRIDGYVIGDFDEANGLIAEDWAHRLRDRAEMHGLEIGELWLPHDAKNRTFLARHSALAQFEEAGFNCRIVPSTSTWKRVNAARTVTPRVRFHPRVRHGGTEGNIDGMARLRGWKFKWDEDRKIFSDEPEKNEHIHAGDAYSYGAQVIAEQKMNVKPPTPRDRYREAIERATKPLTFAEAERLTDTHRNQRRRI